jgi:hypothetical protein
MQPRTPLGAWRAGFLAALGIYPLQSLTACSSEETGTNPMNVGGADSSVSGTGASNASGGKNATGGKNGSGGGSPTATGGANNSGGSGGASSGGAGGSSGSSDAGSAACKNPQPVLVNGVATGFVSCENGAFHREEKKECPTLLPRTMQCGTSPVGDAAIAGGSCNTDADCTAQPNGHCELSAGIGPVQSCFCDYGCRTDADCGAGQICACTSPVGACVVAVCTVDSDCGAGLLCLSTSDGGCGNMFACQTKDDTCASNADCAAVCANDAGCSGPMCSYVPAVSDSGADAGPGSHQCTPMRPCGTGRPFLVGGAARVAGIGERADWASSLVPCLDALSADDRAALAAHYTDVALMEHASIAAFARFALELLALGAPPELLNDTHAAMADETVHARDAFALASAYAGRTMGPGALDVDRALSERERADVVRTAILEGCIGETVAAVEAAEALTYAEDPAVRAALERVVRDETRHAELAWRFVKWVIESNPSGLRDAALEALSTVVASELAASPIPAAARQAPPQAALLAHGALDIETRRELRRRVLADVIEPCAGALVAASDSGGGRRWALRGNQQGGGEAGRVLFF